MSFPKKARGWRPVVVESRRFRWRFRSGERAVLTLQGPASSGRQLIVTMPQWHDPWLFIGHAHLLRNEPQFITARFAAQAVSWALAQGWQAGQAGAALRAEYRDGEFQLVG